MREIKKEHLSFSDLLLAIKLAVCLLHLVYWHTNFVNFVRKDQVLHCCLMLYAACFTDSDKQGCFVAHLKILNNSK